MARFSVVIAVYNKEAFIKKTLDSVLNQTVSDIEIIIVNDGSTDNSEPIINEFNDARIKYYLQENKGAGHARNTAIDKATSPYIALLDADDVWHPYHLETIENLIELYPSKAVFATNSVILQGTKVVPHEYSIITKENIPMVTNFFDASSVHSIINSSTTVVNREVFKKAGIYDPSIKSGQDTDLFIRMGLSHEIVFHPRICVNIIRNSESLSQTTLNTKNKPTFKKFEAQEKNHPKLKKYLDLNRYAMAILAKRGNDLAQFKFYSSKIDMNNLNKKQQQLLKQSPATLQFLFKAKNSLAKLGMKISSFK